MKKIKLIFTLLVSYNLAYAQGGWNIDTNPLNHVTGYTTAYNYVGCSFIELNGDQFVDLYAAPNRVFLNNGNGTFSYTASLPFTELISVAGSSSADLDNDGDNDIIVACVPSRVFFNDGTGNFTDSSTNVPDFTFYGAFGAAIGDFNEDAELDFSFTHANGFLSPSSPSACRLYKQSDVIFNPTAIAGYDFLINLDSYTNPFWSDYDLDGDMDLFISSGPADGTSDFDFCYKNLKIETGIDSLELMTTELFAAQQQDGQCYNFVDFDNDGDFDLCLTNYFSTPTRMYRNDGGTYVNITTPFTTATTNISNCWGDYDNDGDLDVIITNDNQITKYYRNNGDGSFSYLMDGFTTPTATSGITNADFDNDGDLDVFTNGLGNNGHTSSVGLFINDTVAGNRNFVNLKLKGTISNQSAIGAIVRIKATINGSPTWQMREVNAQNTFQGQNDLRVHFGLGDAVVIDSISITWPSGMAEYYEDYASDRFYEITEGSGITILGVLNTREFSTEHVVAIYPNPAENNFKILLDGYDGEILPYTITDILGNEIEKGFIKTANASISISSFPSGTFIFSIQSDKWNITKTIVKI